MPIATTDDPDQNTHAEDRRRYALASSRCRVELCTVAPAPARTPGGICIAPPRLSSMENLVAGRAARTE